MKKPIPNLDLVEKLAKSEAAALGKEFVTPFFGQERVLVVVDGIRCRVGLTRRKPGLGWVVFRLLSYEKASFLRLASLQEVDLYCKTLPKCSVILSERVEETWFGQLVNSKVNKSGPTLVQFVPEHFQRFDTVSVVYDGSNFLFHSQDLTVNPGVGHALREHLTSTKEPPALTSLVIKGLLPEHSQVYEVYRSAALKQAEIAKKANLEYRIKDVLEKVGATFRQHVERKDTVVVTYEVDGRRYTSTVQKNDAFQVESAGLCLSGRDRDFDLMSLVGVLREKHKQDDYDDD